MNIRQLRDLAIKFIGLWCLLTGMMTLLQAFGMLGYLLQSESSVRGAVSAVAYVVALVMYGALVYLLLVKTHVVAGWLWPKEEEAIETSVTTTIEMCVALIGVYYIPSAVSSSASDVMVQILAPESMSGYHAYISLFGDAVLLSVAVLFIVKSKVIAAYIRKCTE
jgi:hypothetical protein